MEITPSEEEFTFSSSGLDIAGAIEDNLCYKAYELLRADHKMPFTCTKLSRWELV